MKKTFYLMMLAAALAGGQAFAYIPTQIDCETGELIEEWYEYDGKYSDTENVSGVQVTVSRPETGGSDMSEISVYAGGVGSGMDCTGNNILMIGGEIYSLCGGSAFYGDGSTVSGNKVVLTGGKAFSIEGATNYCEPNGTLANNQAVIIGGSVGGADANTLGHVYGGFSDTGITARDNTVSLVGNGASITVDGQEYHGNALTINANIMVGTSDGSGNALDIYGSGISLGGGISNTQAMNFYLVDGLASNAAMLTHTGLTNLNLAGVAAYGFDGSAVTDWTSYDGKSIMLVESYNNQIMGVGNDTEVEIMGADGTVQATATLGLTNSGKALSLTNIQSKGTPTPEPATGTLGLLALCALAARKRRK